MKKSWNIFTDDDGNPEGSIIGKYGDLLYAVFNAFCLGLYVHGGYVAYLLLPLTAWQWTASTIKEGKIPDRVILTVGLLMAYLVGRQE